MLIGCLLSGLLPACVREHTLFDDLGSAGATAGNAAGAGGGIAGASSGANAGGADATGKAGAQSANEAGASGAGPVPWEEKTCVAALSSGKTGEACVSTFKCSATSGCCQIIGFCDGKTLTVQSDCGLCISICSADGDCGAGKLCENYECHECSKDACPDGWNNVIRNGCTVCVPPNQCKESSDPTCGSDQACVAGLSCLSGCKEDPTCCFGNRCAAAACGPPDNVDCLLVGCRPGTFCKVAGPAADCACDPKVGKWLCSTPPVNLCAPR